MLTDTFMIQYNKVFDELGQVKNCTREETSKLISLCSSIDNSVDYGDVDKGFMNTNNIQDLYKRLEVSICTTSQG